MASESLNQSNKDAIARLDEPSNIVVSAPVESDRTVATTPENKLAATTTTPKIVESAIDANTIATEPGMHQRATQSHPVVMVKQDERRLPFDQTFEAIIAEQNAYMKHRDHLYLEDYKASHERQLQSMRDRLARQQQRIKDWETHYQRRYDIRADDLKELQELRDSYLPERI